MKIAILAVCAVLVASAPAFARHSEKSLKVLRDSAAALQQDHPDLAQKLLRYADEESAEKESVAEESERQGGHELTAVKQAADALQESRPDLAKGLRRFAKQEVREQKRGWTQRSEHSENVREGAPTR